MTLENKSGTGVLLPFYLFFGDGKMMKIFAGRRSLTVGFMKFIVQEGGHGGFSLSLAGCKTNHSLQTVSMDSGKRVVKLNLFHVAL